MHVVLDPEQLNDADRRVLTHLREGRVTPQYVADREEFSRSYVSQRLKRLVEHKHVDRVAPALYELTDDPEPPES
jgi:predicted transcriptional regulator